MRNMGTVVMVNMLRATDTGKALRRADSKVSVRLPRTICLS